MGTRGHLILAGMSSLRDLLASVAPHLDADVSYEVKLRSGGFRTPYAIKEADSAKQIADACDLLPGDANIIWKAARGGVGGQPMVSFVKRLLSFSNACVTCAPKHKSLRLVNRGSAIRRTVYS